MQHGLSQTMLVILMKLKKRQT